MLSKYYVAPSFPGGKDKFVIFGPVGNVVTAVAVVGLACKISTESMEIKTKKYYFVL